MPPYPVVDGPQPGIGLTQAGKLLLAEVSQAVGRTEAAGQQKAQGFGCGQRRDRRVAKQRRDIEAGLHQAQLHIELDLQLAPGGGDLQIARCGRRIGEDRLRRRAADPERFEGQLLLLGTCRQHHKNEGLSRSRVALQPDRVIQGDRDNHGSLRKTLRQWVQRRRQPDWHLAGTHPRFGQVASPHRRCRAIKHGVPTCRRAALPQRSSLEIDRLRRAATVD